MSHDPDRHPDRADTVKPVIDALEQWQSELDPVQRARLAAARHRALAVRPAPGRGLGWLAPGLAAGLLLALGVSFWPSPVTPPVAVPPAAELVAGELLGTDEALLDEDAEYLLWLASDDAG